MKIVVVGIAVGVVAVEIVESEVVDTLQSFVPFLLNDSLMSADI